MIEGLAESSLETDLIDDICSVINKALPHFKKERLKVATRLGKERKSKKKPRPILVTVDGQHTRDLLLAKAPDIRRGADNKSLWINRDQNENAKCKYALVKACYKLLLKNKYPCSMKGSTITYNKRQYTYEMLNLLPESCTPLATRSRCTEDGTGLCFFSEHVYCSNFAPAKIKYKSRVFTSVEHAYQYGKVKAAGYTELAAEMTA